MALANVAALIENDENSTKGEVDRHILGLSELMPPACLENNSLPAIRKLNEQIRELLKVKQKFSLYPLETGVQLPPPSLRVKGSISQYMQSFPIPKFYFEGELTEFTLVLLVDYIASAFKVGIGLSLDDITWFLASIINGQLSSLAIHWLGTPQMFKETILFFLRLNSYEPLTAKDRKMLSVLYLALNSEEYRKWVRYGDSLDDLLQYSKFLKLLKESTLTSAELPRELEELYDIVEVD